MIGVLGGLPETDPGAVLHVQLALQQLHVEVRGKGVGDEFDSGREQNPGPQVPAESRLFDGRHVCAVSDALLQRRPHVENS